MGDNGEEDADLQRIIQESLQQEEERLREIDDEERAFKKALKNML